MKTDEEIVKEIKTLCKEIANHPGLDIDMHKLDALNVLSLQYIIDYDRRVEEWKSIPCTD